MSERKIRELITEYHESHEPSEYEHCFCPTCQKRTVLAADPDVVAVLRWLKDGAKRIPGNTPVDRAWTSAARALEVHIERTFHVRLTDDGYEWIGDEK